MFCCRKNCLNCAEVFFSPQWREIYKCVLQLLFDWCKQSLKLFFTSIHPPNHPPYHPTTQSGTWFWITTKQFFKPSFVSLHFLGQFCSKIHHFCTQILNFFFNFLKEPNFDITLQNWPSLKFNWDPNSNLNFKNQAIFGFLIAVSNP